MQKNYKERTGKQLEVGNIVEIEQQHRPGTFSFFFLLKKRKSSSVFLILDEQGQIKERVFRTDDFLYFVINDQ